MMIPNYIDVPVINLKTGKFTAEWGVIFQQLFTQLVKNASDQGLVVPSQTNAKLLIIQNSLNPQTVPPTFISQPGTLLFDTTIVNGGSVPAPNGQLYVKLQDNVFHPIVNV